MLFVTGRCIILKKKLFAVLTAVIILSITVISIHFLTTKSVEQCFEYCTENSRRSATQFLRIGDGRYVHDYSYLIAADGDASMGQEIFVFRKTSLFSAFGLDRYRLVISSAQGSETSEKSVGSLLFQTRNDKGKKDDGYTLLFYCSSAGNDIVEYEYVLEENGKEKSESGGVKYGNDAWLVVFTDIGENKKLKEICFYDKNHNLICEY